MKLRSSCYNPLDLFDLSNWISIFDIPKNPSSYPRSPNLCPEVVVDCVGKQRIFNKCSCLIAPLCGYESALWRTRVLLPKAGRKVADWLLRGFIQCVNVQVLIARSITASVHKFGAVCMTMPKTEQRFVFREDHLSTMCNYGSPRMSYSQSTIDYVRLLAIKYRFSRRSSILRSHI